MTDDLPTITARGDEGKIVEADETYHGKTGARRVSPSRKGQPFTKKGRGGMANKRAIVGLVERSGRVRMFHVAVADKASINAIVTENIAKESRLHTDESRLYGDAPAIFETHETVKHSINEYVRGDVTRTQPEGVFSIFKRGIRGVRQHCDEKHLHRYLAEYDFRYNHRSALGIEDAERTIAAVTCASGKRLTYHQSHSA